MDTHGMKFVVDTTGVAKGFRDYKSAVDGIFSSLDKFEAHVNKTMKGVANAANNKAALSQFRKGLEGFSDIKVDGTAARRIGALGTALSGFKAPSQQQSSNLRKFFSALGTMPNLTNAYRSIKAIDDLNIAMRGFKAPPATQAKRLAEFARIFSTAVPMLRSAGSISGLAAGAAQITTLSNALANLKMPSKGAITNLGNLALALRAFNFSNLSGSGNMFAVLSTIGSFKAPSAAQIKNLQNFVAAVGNMRVPANGFEVARLLSQIAAASASAQRSMGGFRTGMAAAGQSFGPFNRGAQQAKLQMMGLQNAFSATFQIGSVLRSLFGALTVAELGRGFFEATNKVAQFRAQMGVLEKDARFAGAQLSYVRDTANKFGVDMLSAMEGFGKVSIAADKAGMTVLKTRHVFEGFSTAMAVLGTTTSGQGDVWLALQQVMNKGYLSAEELNQQLNEKLPGAMAYAGEYAAKLGVTLEKGLKDKILDADGVLQHIAKRFKEDFGPSLASALDRPSAQMNILKNNVTSLYLAIGDAGATSAFSNLLKNLNQALDPSVVNGFAQSVGQGLADAVNKASAAFSYLRANWDSIKGPLGTTLSLMGKWMVLMGGFQIVRSLVMPLLQLRTAMLAASAGFVNMTAAGAAFSVMQTRLLAGTQPLLAGLASLNLRAQATTIGFNVLRVAGNALMMGFSGLLSLVGGPLGAAFIVLTSIITGVAGEVMSLNATMANVQPTINSTSQFLQDLGLKALSAASGTNQLAAQQAGAVPSINSFAGATGEAATQLYRLADAQKKAALSRIADDYSKIAKDRNQLNMFASGQAANPTKIGSAGDFFRAVKAGGARYYDKIIENGAGIAEATKKVKVMDGALQELAQSYKVVQGMAVDKFVPPGFTGGGGASPKVKTEDSGKKKKTPKGKDPYSVMDRMQSKSDGILRRLGEDNPALRLQVEYINDLTEQAQQLLSKDAFTKWAKGVEDGSLSSAEALNQLKFQLFGAGANTTVLTDIEKRHGITVDDLSEALNRQAEAYDYKLKLQKEDQTFGAKMLRQMNEEAMLSSMSEKQARVTLAVQEEVLRYKEKYGSVTGQVIDQLHKEALATDNLIDKNKKLKDFFENNGVRSYLNELKDVGTAANELDKNVFQSLEDQLVSLGTKGTFSFSAIFDTIQEGLIRVASQDLMKTAITGIFGKEQLENGTPSLTGKLFEAMGMKYEADTSTQLGTLSNPMKVYVTNEGMLGMGGRPAARKAKVFMDDENGNWPAGMGPDGPTNGPVSDKITDITAKTAVSFKDNLTSMLPMLGIAFAGAFKSPIAQIGGMFLSMMLTKMMQSQAAGGGGGGFLGSLGKIVGGLFGGGGITGATTAGLNGSAQDLISSMPGIFKEGGFSNSPVARMSASAASFANAPHYREGTHNTSGIPAMLHDNEAVIPLSRGRKVPVEMAGGNSKKATVINQNFNITSPDADSFRKSQQQIATEMHATAGRAYHRNNA